MSAFIVGRPHIEYLIEGGLRFGRPLRWFSPVDTSLGSHGVWKSLDRDNATEVGQMLWEENIRSVAHRYPDCGGPGADNLPGPIGEDFKYSHRIAPLRTVDPVWVLKGADCLEYQSCEHEGWTDSEACAFLSSLRRSAVAALRGYEDAPWEIS